MKLRSLGMFALGVGGTAWAALGLAPYALVCIGFFAFAIAIYCAGYRQGEYTAIFGQGGDDGT